MGHAALTSPDFAEQDNTGDEAIPILAMVPDVSRLVRLQEQAQANLPSDIGGESIAQESIDTDIGIEAAESIDARPASEVALDLVLNEIVLQARLTTNATGAVLGLGRHGALVCRGTTGATAPDVAVCLNAKSGIAATCFETGAVRRVDDLGVDENDNKNADAVAYRRVGVRSILVVPVQGEKGPVLGILEIFSPRANAFSERDVLTLQALARRIATNVELVQKGHIEQVPGQRSNQPNRGSRANTGGTEKLAQASASASLSRLGPRLKSSRLWATARDQRKSLASVDWISVMAKSAGGMVLIAASISALSCWQHGGSAQLLQAIGGPVKRTVKMSEPHSPQATASGLAPVSSNSASQDISTLQPKAHSTTISSNTSITIQRQPLRKAEASQPSKEPISRSVKKSSTSGDLVLFEDHNGDDHKKEEKAQKTESNLSSKEAAAAGPDIETLTTQAAMARVVQRVEPEYPNAARQQHIQGTVVLDVVVGANGAVDTISLVRGNAQLMPAAADAVRQWHFQPLVENGRPKKFESRVPIDFALAFEGSGPGH